MQTFLLMSCTSIELIRTILRAQRVKIITAIFICTQMIIMRQMRKQKSQLMPPCKCSELQEQLNKIKAKLVLNLKQMGSPETNSAYKLLKLHLYTSHEREKYINSIEDQLREYARQNPTIQYNEEMSIPEMISNLMLKIQKEKTIRLSVVEKEREIINKYISQNRTASEEIDYLKELLLEEQREQESWKHEALKYEKANGSLKKEIQLKKKENNLLQELTKKLQLRICSLEVKISSLQKDKAQLSKDFFEKSEEVAKLASDFKSFKGQLAYKTKIQLNKNLQSINTELSNDFNVETTRLSKQTEAQEKKYLFNHLFVGDIFYGEDQSRHFLIETIQNHHKNAITRTKFIYKMDLYNTTNIHRYIDGIPHLLILIKTDHGQLIAAYSEGTFKAKTISNKDGMLISITSTRVFNNTKKAIIYDQSEVIFGNYDLKIKNGDSKLVSNFASSNSFYECRGETVSSLLGQGKNREIKMKTFEIYQIFFEV